MRPSIGTTIAIALLAATLAAPSSIASPATFEGRDGRILFSRYHATTDTWTLHTIRPDGNGRRKVGDPGAGYFEPTYSPDGTNIAFWRFVGDAAHIFVMKANGSNPTQLTTGAGGYRTGPVWSPDGSKVAYRESPEIEGAASLNVIGNDGNGHVRLTPEDGVAVEPAWSPDSSTLVYVSVEGDQAVLNRTDLWLVGADGGDRRPFTSSKPAELSPSWAPEGDRIFFARSRATGSDLFSKRVSGKLRRLTRSKSSESSPKVSPDGEWVSFRRCTRRCSLWVMRPGGGDKTRLIERGFDGSPQTWSPSSKKLLVSKLLKRNGRHTYDLVVVRVEDGRKSFLTRTRAFETNDSWQAR